MSDLCSLVRSEEDGMEDSLEAKLQRIREREGEYKPRRFSVRLTREEAQQKALERVRKKALMPPKKLVTIDGLTIVYQNGSPVNLWQDPEGYLWAGDTPVQKLVMAQWGPPKPFEGAIIRHLNDVKTDNRLENLAWGTARDNTNDKRLNGIVPVHSFASASLLKKCHENLDQLSSKHLPDGMAEKVKEVLREVRNLRIERGHI